MNLLLDLLTIPKLLWWRASFYWSQRNAIYMGERWIHERRRAREMD